MIKIGNLLRSMPGILAFFAVLFLALTAVFFLRYREATMRNETLKTEIVSLTKAKKQISREMEELEVIKRDLEERISGLETEKRTLSDNYEREKAANSGIRAELESKKSELLQKEGQLEKMKTENDGLKSKLSTEMAEYDRLRDKVDKLIEVKNVLEEKVRQIMDKEGIELERIVVRAEGVLEGRVLVVNAEYGFIVVDIGEKDDVVPGDIITVYSGADFIGEADVEKVYDTMSAATITKEARPGAIKVGDNAVVKGK